HLTFKFLGGTDPARLEAIGDAIENQARARSPFALVTGPQGFFGSRNRPRVLWTAIEGDLEAAERLARSLEDSMHALGFPREDRPFRPHLTLARFDSERRIRI